MFTKQNKNKMFMFIKQNKSLHTNYIYKTKYKTESLQNKNKNYIQVYNKTTIQNKSLQTRYVDKTKQRFTTQMFTKQNTKQKVYQTKLKFINITCL